MIKRKKKEGFTLIELLVTITVVSIIMVVTVVFVNKVIETSEEKSIKITESNILRSASQYTKEFKLEDTDYWFNESIEKDGETVEIEYACTTIGMLINKGFLKSSVLGLVLENETTIEKTTSVKVSRDKNTKVFTNETIFNDSACSETGDINLTLTHNGTSNPGYETWYNNDVTISVVANNLSAIAESNVIVKVNGTQITNPEVTENNKKQSDWHLIVGTQGENIDVCINIYGYKEYEKEFCLEEQIYNMDKENPTSPNLSLIQNENYQLVSAGSTDTISSTLTYYLSKNENTSENSATYDIPTTERLTVEEIITYAIDQAGNKSSEVIGYLSITDSVTKEATISEKYYCSFDTNTIYATQQEAVNACSYDVTNSQSYYVCSLDQSQYQNKTEATNNCINEETGTVSTNYYCGDTLSTSTSCIEQKTVRNDIVCYYTSKSDILYFTYDWEQTSDCTELGSNYSISSSSCQGCPATIRNCPTSLCGSIGSLYYYEYSCTNACSSSYTAETKYYCSVTEDYVSSLTASCVKTTSGDITEVPQYYCEYTKQIYTVYDEAIAACTGTISSDIKYYCSLTDSFYDTNNQATNACTNYCTNGNYYSNACYSLN